MNVDQQKHIGYLIKQISDKIAAQGNGVLRQYGLTYTQSRVLAFLDGYNGRATQKEIETDLGVTHPTVVGIVTRLEREGFIHCWQDDKDRRIKNVEMTEKARKTAKILDRSIRQDEYSLSEIFTPEESDQLISYLNRLNDQLDRKLEKIRAGWPEERQRTGGSGND